MSKESSKDSGKSSGHHHHDFHLHLPKKPGRSHSSGRVSPISFLSAVTGHWKSNGHHSSSEGGHGNGKNEAGNGVKIKDSISAPPSSHGSPTGSPTQRRKSSLGSSSQVGCVYKSIQIIRPVNCFRVHDNSQSQDILSSISYHFLPSYI